MDIDFSPTAFTVKDPGNGKERRYEATLHPQMVASAARAFTLLAADWPALGRLVVPDHFIQLFCQAEDAASWSGSFGVSIDRQREIFLDLLETAVRQNQFS
jgi:hypothetical protein